MKPEVPFAEQEASFQQPCIAEVCKKYICLVIIHTKNLRIKMKSPLKHEIKHSFFRCKNELLVSQVSSQ
jgi:hypothetical protein